MASDRAVLLAIFAAIIPLAQAGDFKASMDIANRLREQGDFAAAERALVSLLTEVGERDTRRAVVLHELGSVYHSQGRFREAESRYKTALALLSESTGNQRLNCTLSLAALYVEYGEYGRAERLDLARLEKGFVPEARFSREWAKLNSAQGSLACARGLYKRSEEYFHRAVATWEVVAPQSVDMVQALSNLTLLYTTIGRAEHALAASERALKIAETAMGPVHPDKVILLANVASLHSKVYGAASSEPYFKAALAIGEQTLGPEHLLVGQILFEYSTVLQQLKRKAEARACRKRAESIFLTSPIGVAGRHTVHISDLARVSGAR